jgi:hypothetical protein
MNENFWMAPAGYAACNFLDIFVAPHNCISEKTTSPPQPIRVGTHHPQLMEMDFLPPELSKTGQITH